MKKMVLMALALTAGLAFADEQQARVKVSYTDTSKFVDFGDSQWDRERNEKDFAAMLQELGKTLPAGQQLSLKFTDVNLAGELDWWRARSDRVRVMRSITWPLVEFEYQLSEGGRVLKSGTARVTDMSYLQHSITGSPAGSEAYKYEQRMLARWVKTELLR